MPPVLFLLHFRWLLLLVACCGYARPSSAQPPQTYKLTNQRTVKDGKQESSSPVNEAFLTVLEDQKVITTLFLTSGQGTAYRIDQTRPNLSGAGITLYLCNVVEGQNKEVDGDVIIVNPVNKTIVFAVLRDNPQGQQMHNFVEYQYESAAYQDK
jgi:hypothetical protein